METKIVHDSAKLLKMSERRELQHIKVREGKLPMSSVIQKKRRRNIEYNPDLDVVLWSGDKLFLRNNTYLQPVICSYDNAPPRFTVRLYGDVQSTNPYVRSLMSRLGFEFFLRIKEWMISAEEQFRVFHFVDVKNRTEKTQMDLENDYQFEEYQDIDELADTITEIIQNKI